MYSLRVKKGALRWLIGIDEAGRGPLAGPVSVAAFCVATKDQDDILQKHFQGVRDSKKLTPLARERFFAQIRELAKSGMVRYSVSLVSASVIDKIGIAPAVRLGIKRCLKKLSLDPRNVHLKLDGSLRAPLEYFQETIIHGDDLVPIISLASVVAKVHRDRRMVRFAKKYPQYGFEIHKGYGTKAHYEAIKKHGFSEGHRRTFLKGLPK